MTISFFDIGKQEQCESGDVKNAITLTANTIPTEYTCFNVSDIFSSNASTGFQNDTYGDSLRGAPEPRGVFYLLKNMDAYDKDANYTNIWWKNVNDTGDIGDGDSSRWVIHTYAFDDCEQVGLHDEEYDYYPWYTASCQTGSDGKCQMAPKAIKSFAIASAYKYEGDGDCSAWAKLSVAPRLGQQASMMAGLVAGAAAYFLVL